MANDDSRIVSSYFDAWRAHDPGALRALLADDATFAGPLGHSDNADDYAEAIGRMFAITTDIVIEKMIADDGDVLTWFELHTSVAPPAAVANWSRIEDGKIVRVRATFDPRSIIAARGGHDRRRRPGSRLFLHAARRGSFDRFTTKEHARPKAGLSGRSGRVLCTKGKDAVPIAGVAAVGGIRRRSRTTCAGAV